MEWSAEWVSEWVDEWVHWGPNVGGLPPAMERFEHTGLTLG